MQQILENELDSNYLASFYPVKGLIANFRLVGAIKVVRTFLYIN